LPAWLRPVVVTYPSEGPNGYDDLLPRIAAAVEALPHCYVLGWSFSGPLALRIANRLPERVRGVILGASFVRPPLRSLPWLRPLLNAPVIGTVLFLRRLPLWLFTPPSDPWRRDKALVWQRVRARSLAARVRAIAGVDARDDLRRCAAPVLYIAGDQDIVVPPRNLAEVRRERPATHVATIAGGHFALYGNAAAGVAAIVAFVREQRR